MTTKLPQNPESEEALLGAVLINPEAFGDCSAFLTAEDFYIRRNGFVWAAIESLHRTGQPMDFLTIANELDRMGNLSEVGGPAHLTSLLNQSPSSLHAEAYARDVRQNAIRRRLIEAASKMAQDAYNETVDTDKALVDGQNSLNELMAHSTGHEVGTLAPVLSALHDEIKERAEHPRDVWGIPIGLPRFDQETGGQQLGEMTILAGEPGIGKTWFALGAALEMSKTTPGAFFSLEMRAPAIARRLLAGVSGIRSRALKTGHVEENDWVRLYKAIGSLEVLPFYLDDRARDTASLRATLARLKRERGITWFVADYMQLFGDEGKDDNERTKTISRELKHTCADLELAGIVINSVNKQGMDKGGSDAHAKSNMSGSGQAIHDADLVLFLTEFQPDSNRIFYSEEEKKRMATLWVKKGRELEDPRVRVNLVRKQNSPFWGEMADR
jgi:replicative DNA helicase